MRLIDADKLTEWMIRELRAMPNGVFNNLNGRQAANLIGKAIDEAPTVGGWISVKDKLPKNGQKVVAISVNGFCEVVNFEERTGRWVGMEGWYPTDRIAHWMSLPEPPKEVK